MKKVSLFICFVLFFLGCATGAIRETASPLVRFSKYQSICVIVSASDPEWSWEASSLKGVLISKLDESKMFGNITTNASSADLQLNVFIVGVKRVSESARMMVGAMAGRAGINTEVKLYDVQSGDCIASFDAYGRSSGGTAFAGTTGQAIEQVADQICNFLQKNK